MGHWGWRPLISALFISVWITGCSINSDATLTLPPTILPPVTLTLRNQDAQAPPTQYNVGQVTTPTINDPQTSYHTAQLYTLRPGDTLLGIALDYGLDVVTLQSANPEINPHNLQVGEQIVIPPPDITLQTPQSPVTLPAPACYPSIAGSLLCVGMAHNHQDETITQVRVRVTLTDQFGAVLQQQTGIVEQNIIPPGGAAPYRIIFHDVLYSGIKAQLETANTAASTLADPWLMLQATAQATYSEHNHYGVEALLYNETGRAVGPIRITLTVLNDAQEVIGFRSVTMNTELAVDETSLVHLETTIQDAQQPASHYIHAEAQALSS